MLGFSFVTQMTSAVVKSSPLRLPKADAERTSCIGCCGPGADSCTAANAAHQ